MMTIDKAFKLGFAFGKGYSYSLEKIGMAMDDWVTLKNKEGENYRVNLPGENPNRKDSEKKSENKPKHELKDKHDPKTGRVMIDGMSENTLALISKLSDEEKEKAKEYIRKQTERFANLPENLVRINIETMNSKIASFSRHYQDNDSDAKKRTEVMMHSVRDVLKNRLDELVKGKHKNYPPLGEKQKYLRSPQKVVRETEKAVAIKKDWDGITYKETQGGTIHKDDLIWLPKSRTTIKDGIVYGTEPWIANKGEIAMDSVNALLE